MKQKRFRLRFTFWLDLNKPDESALADTIAALKDARTFATTVRDGIRLICDLRAGRVDVLCELFPAMRQRMQPAPASADFEALIAQAVSAAMAKQEPPKALPPRVQIAASTTTAKEIANNFLSSMKNVMGGWVD